MKFFNNMSYKDNITAQISDIGQNTYSSATLLSENKVFVSYIRNKILYGCICTFSNERLICGTSIQLADNATDCISTIRLTENEVFISFNYNNSSTSAYFIYGILCSINDTSISIIYSNGLTSNLKYTSTSKALGISENQVFIAYYVQNSATKVIGMLCNITETGFESINTFNVDIRTDTGTLQDFSITKLNKNKILIVSTLNTLKSCARIIEFAGENTYSTSDIIELCSTVDSITRVSTIKLSENKVINIYRGYSTGNIYALACKIDGNMITTGTLTKLTDEVTYNISVSIVSLSETNVMILYCKNDNNRYLMGMQCEVDEDSIIVKNILQLSDEVNSGLYMSSIRINQDIFITHAKGTSRLLNSMLYKTNKEISALKIQKETDRIAGVAQTSGTDGQLIKVYVPNYIKEEN